VPNGTGGYSAATDIITDLANNTSAVNPLIRTDMALVATQLNSSESTASALGGVTGSSAASINNRGGISIPGFGSLVQGTTSGSSIAQQLQAGAVGIVGSATSSLSNAVTGGIAKGLGKNGTAIVGLAAQVISNPSAALKTVQNMATQYAIAKVSNYVSNDLIAPLSEKISNKVAGLVTDNIANPISEAWAALPSFGSLTQSFSNFFSTSNLPIDNIDYANF
jgi:hypothetical protein